MTPESFLDELADKVASKVNLNGSPDDGKHKFLGIALGGWTKMIAAWVMAGLVALAAWHLTIRDELRVKPNIEQVEMEFKKHDKISDAHPPIQARLKVIEGEQRTIRESQIRQEANDSLQTQVLQEIKDDVKGLRRKRNR